MDVFITWIKEKKNWFSPYQYVYIERWITHLSSSIICCWCCFFDFTLSVSLSLSIFIPLQYVKVLFRNNVNQSDQDKSLSTSTIDLLYRNKWMMIRFTIVFLEIHHNVCNFTATLTFVKSAKGKNRSRLSNIKSS